MQHRGHKETGLFLLELTGSLSQYEIITTSCHLSSPPARVFIRIQLEPIGKAGVV